MKRVLWSAVIGALAVSGLVLFAPLRAIAGLESPCSFISDLVSTNPLSSDLASTSDDHLRCIKAAVKASFPNVNGAVSATDEQLSPGGLGANPTGTIGLTAVNGSATTYVRSDGAPALSQAIAPTWTAAHIFSNANPALTASSASPLMRFIESGVTAENTTSRILVDGEVISWDLCNDAVSSCSQWMSVQRTANTLDSVTFAGRTISTQSGGGSAAGLSVRTGTPGVFLDATGATANNGNWDFVVSSEQLLFRILNDAEDTASNWLTVDRTGTTVDTINLLATTLQHNGVSISGTTGTFTATATGLTTSPSGTGTYTKTGNIVVLHLPLLSGTSNATSFTYTGLPAAIQSATLTQMLPLPQGLVTNGGVGNAAAEATITAGSGTITFAVSGNAAGWSASSTKGFTAGTGGFTIVYTVQ